MDRRNSSSRLSPSTTITTLNEQEEPAVQTMPSTPSSSFPSRYSSRIFSISSIDFQLCTTPKPLSMKTKLGYSLGHVFNDMTVSIWFSYTLLFFQNRLPGGMAGILILLGQISDALASPVIGYISDRYAHRWPFNRFGRRKVWHMLGVACNLFIVPLVYNRCMLGDGQAQSIQFIYYSILVIIFQAAWAVTQVTHVALVNDLTDKQSERIELNSYRNAATMAANIMTFMITFFLLKNVSNDDDGSSVTSSMNSDDMIAFTPIREPKPSVIPLSKPKQLYVISKGDRVSTLARNSISSPSSSDILAHFGPQRSLERQESVESIRAASNILTRKLRNEIILNNGLSPRLSFSGSISSLPDMSQLANLATMASNDDDTNNVNNKSQWYHWLRSFCFWKFTIIYTAARMFINVSQVYMPIYLQQYLILSKETVAIIPLATYVTSFIFSFFTNGLTKHIGTKILILIGSAVGIATSLYIWFGKYGLIFRYYQIYAVAAMIGIAGTILLISSLSLNSDLIGNHLSSNAFVFAAMSLVDKTINGIVIGGLEQFKPETEIDHQTPIEYFQYVMVALTAIPSIIIILITFTILQTKYGRKIGKIDLNNAIMATL
ncbi:hypothetical protein RDWZM_010364 [Blomia tropicalis]|uniref:Major facilitator superfamily domain-containing protein 12-like n=1 Tax=Blomia tropicalis TaxID=40697 RepID=A0A9Q0LYM2_BLOTA|nr:hypothetical protein RDWZM_010364 [Blomia tropicalis]